jgi:Flp pilus assembly pilin Flp
MAPAQAQNAIEYGLLIATLAIGVLLGGILFGAVIQAWLKALLDRITAT